MMDTKEETAQEQQITVFRLSDEIYGADIRKVYEIIMLQKITKIPRTPHFVEGIINLRGKIIPVIDLRKRLRLSCKDFGEDTRIMVVDIGGNTAGAIVDEVSEVLSISRASVEPPSSLVTGTVETEYLEGIINQEDRLIILLNIEKILTESEKENLADMDKSITEVKDAEN